MCVCVCVCQFMRGTHAISSSQDTPILGINSSPESSFGFYCAADANTFPEVFERLKSGTLHTHTHKLTNTHCYVNIFCRQIAVPGLVADADSHQWRDISYFSVERCFICCQRCSCNFIVGWWWWWWWWWRYVDSCYAHALPLSSYAITYGDRTQVQKSRFASTYIAITVAISISISITISITFIMQWCLDFNICWFDCRNLISR